MDDKTYVMGVDYGSDSVRAIILDANDGTLAASGTAEYPRWKQGLYSEPEKKRFRQHPLDHMECLISCVREAVASAGEKVRDRIVAIGFDATASTPAPFTKEGVPLALTKEFQEDPDAMFHLWKDHSSWKEAGEITKTFGTYGYLKYQGPYQSEWYWAKILHTVRNDKRVRDAAYSWVELADWIPNLLSGNTNVDTMYRDAGNAGHKAYYHSDFHGLPSKECLASLDPYLAHIPDTFAKPRVSTSKVGNLTKEWADKLNLKEGIVIAGSSIDAHAGAVGAGVGPGTLVKTIGTSAVDLFVAERETVEKGHIDPTVCGMAENSVVPGYYGMETGQAAFGDVYAWYKRLLLSPVRTILEESGLSDDVKRQALVTIEKGLLPLLDKQAGKDQENDNLIALGWLNGRRYPVLNEHIKGAIAGIDLSVTSSEVYRSLVMATIFESKQAFLNYRKAGIPIDRIVAIGGIPKKSPLVMQMMSDIFSMPILVSDIKEACARGSAVFAAVASGIYPSMREAQDNLCRCSYTEYRPNQEKRTSYERLFAKYETFGSWYEKSDMIEK